ncbi:metal ABC transporter ATP-binding protein [Dermatobacter hominis]|uniref:metal ABC transporter ATP-binding protein n=1 Tax=Dermatobacter hominis TaxID=2884263 RepID=UPI001D129DF0|nr:ATP-binding cassette domain-containing protein [Dermatobacter hominis]UDY37234.1 ATP-binding cassette domain-containing protein [Dermatobacter hominis]
MTGPTAPAPAPPVVSLRDVEVRRGDRTVWSRGTFDIAAGSVVGVIGPNGSGKSTLLQLLLGLLDPATGTVEVLGGPARRGDRRIGYVPQDDGAQVAEAVRCRDLVALGLSGHRYGPGGLGARRREREARVQEALHDVEAEAFAGRRMSQVSGGQRQRVALAQALVDRPELLLLDEPLANLDVRNQHEAVQFIGRVTTRRAAEGRPVTTLVVTHDINPLLSVLTGAVYLLDGHPHYADIGDVVDEELLSHLYGTSVRVVRTAQGDLFTRSG